MAQIGQGKWAFGVAVALAAIVSTSGAPVVSFFPHPPAAVSEVGNGPEYFHTPELASPGSLPGRAEAPEAHHVHRAAQLDFPELAGRVVLELEAPPRRRGAGRLARRNGCNT
mgnify:CR=1 FL=1